MPLINWPRWIQWCVQPLAKDNDVIIIYLFIYLLDAENEISIKMLQKNIFCLYFVVISSIELGKLLKHIRNYLISVMHWLHSFNMVQHINSNFTEMILSLFTFVFCLITYLISVYLWRYFRRFLFVWQLIGIIFSWIYFWWQVWNHIELMWPVSQVCLWFYVQD